MPSLSNSRPDPQHRIIIIILSISSIQMDASKHYMAYYCILFHSAVITLLGDWHTDASFQLILLSVSLITHLHTDGMRLCVCVCVCVCLCLPIFSCSCCCCCCWWWWCFILFVHCCPPQNCLFILKIRTMEATNGKNVLWPINSSVCALIWCEEKCIENKWAKRQTLLLNTEDDDNWGKQWSKQEKFA